MAQIAVLGGGGTGCYIAAELSLRGFSVALYEEKAYWHENIDGILEQYGDKITVMGGINNQMIDMPESTEEQIRGEVRRAMDAYGHKGRYIPYYIPTREDKWLIYMDEVRKYGAEFFRK